AALRRESSATYWLEVMLLEGYTAEDLQVQQLAERIRSIQPDSVQLNTAVRPPAAECAMAVPPARLAQIAGLFEPPAEVIAEYRGKHASEESEASADAILELIQRRPCTMEDIAHGLEMKPAEVVKSLAVLEERGAILGERRGSGLFYRPAT
ncbi:MAG: radical SAM protein, partial [Planctomycetes bacterium]|nr:radical SAM protein [Planctomycetota bacterium]